MKDVQCHICGLTLMKNEVSLNKKLVSRSVKKYKCLCCLADFMGCTSEDLLIKIEEFKNQGCTLF
jgi:hypothetical protein